MKMAEINVGDIVVIGRNRGQDGTESTGVKATVLETGIMYGPYSFRQRPVGVRVKFVDGDREKTLASRDLLSLADHEAQMQANAEADAERSRRTRLVEARRLEIVELLRRHGLAAQVRMAYEESTDGAKLNSIEFSNIRYGREQPEADQLVAFLERL